MITHALTHINVKNTKNRERERESTKIEGSDAIGEGVGAGVAEVTGEKGQPIGQKL